MHNARRVIRSLVRLSRSDVHGQNNRINSEKLIHKCRKFIISDFEFRFRF